MKSFAVLLVALAAANAAVIPATTLFRAPAHDSAIIQSDRLGGNFAYSVQEAHAYGAVSPIITNVKTPVAVSYSTPAVVAHAAPIAAPVTHFAAPIAYEAPKIELKAIEAPKIEFKTVELPKFEYQTVELPKVEFKTVELPKFEYKTVELPKVEYKTIPAPVTYTHGLPLTYSGVPVAYSGLPWTHAAAPLSLVEVKAEEKKTE